MATTKKSTAKKPAKPKPEPEPQGPQVEGFTVVEYEGLDKLDCERCDFNTFDVGSAKTHLEWHARADADAELRDSMTEHLAETSQVTEEAADEQG